ncbi:phosphopantetheine-binding protein [Synechococcus sp. AH-551-A21]|nr:phosphopantetheine-binding protein [Synechococcus sp. AH-551-A21]MDB4677563.1 phosphopantetheine-binding protein [Synechococcus sp. AH-551-A21]
MNTYDLVLKKIKSKISSPDIDDLERITLEDLDLDSLEFMELIMEIEDEFNVFITDEELDPGITVSEWIFSAISSKS